MQTRSQKSARAGITGSVQFTETDGARPPRVAKVCNSGTVGPGVFSKQESEIAGVAARFWSRDRHSSGYSFALSMTARLSSRGNTPGHRPRLQYILRRDNNLTENLAVFDQAETFDRALQGKHLIDDGFHGALLDEPQERLDVVVIEAVRADNL